MHRSKKMAVATTGLVLLMAAGMTSAMASNNNGNDKVTVCHATGSTTNPVVRIHIPRHTAEEKGHFTHGGDTIVNDPNNVEQCETPPPPGGGDHDVTICHPLGGGKFERIHTSESDNDTLVEHTSHGDHIVRDDDDFWPCPTPPVDEDDNNRGCNATSESGDTTQTGLVNVDADAANLGANLLCQAKIPNYVTAAVLGHATGGSGGDADSAGGCNADSTAGNTTQYGLVNADLDAANLAANTLCQAKIRNYVTAAVLGHANGASGGDADSADEGCNAESTAGNTTQIGAVNADVNAANLAAKTLCQSEILNYLTLAVLGHSTGGSALDSGLLGGGMGGVLTGLLHADASLLAKVVVLL